MGYCFRDCFAYIVHTFIHYLNESVSIKYIDDIIFCLALINTDQQNSFVLSSITNILLVNIVIYIITSYLLSDCQKAWHQVY